MAWSAPGGRKIDEPGGLDPPDLVEHYEALRCDVLFEKRSHAGLGAHLLLTRGMPAWIRGWQALPVAHPLEERALVPLPSGEIVSVLATMALACK